jgi:hypothetical protein
MDFYMFSTVFKPIQCAQTRALAHILICPQRFDMQMIIAYHYHRPELAFLSTLKNVRDPHFMKTEA